MAVLLVALAYFANVVIQTYTAQVEQFGYAQVVLVLVLLIPLAASRVVFSARAVAALAFLVYLAWAFGSATVPVSDFLVNYWERAAAFAAERTAGHWSTSLSPPTIAYYAIFIALLGKSYVATYVASALAWAVSAGLLMKALVNFRLEPRAASLAGLMYALAPSTIAYSSVVSPEAVFNLLLMGALWALSMAHRQDERRLAFLTLSSACFAFLFLTRPVGLFFLLGALLSVFALPEVNAAKQRRHSLVSLALVGPFAAIVLLNAAVTYATIGEFRLNPHGGGAHNLLIGTNYATKGTYSQDDIELAGFQGPNTVSPEEAAANAKRIAFERIGNDPVRFVRFALTDKVTSMWGSDAQGLYWSLQGSPRLEAMRASGLYEAMVRVTEAYYLLCMALFAAALAWTASRRERAMIAAPWLLPLLAIAALHVFIETQGRYHVPVMPFVYSAAALIIVRLSAGLRRSTPAAKPGPATRLSRGTNSPETGSSRTPSLHA